MSPVHEHARIGPRWRARMLDAVGPFSLDPVLQLGASEVGSTMSANCLRLLALFEVPGTIYLLTSEVVGTM